MVTLDFIFRLVLYSRDDVSFNIIFFVCVGKHKTVSLVNVVKKTRLVTPFKGDNVKALIKTSNCDNLVLYFSRTVQKIVAFAMLFWFQ